MDGMAWFYNRLFVAVLGTVAAGCLFAYKGCDMAEQASRQDERRRFQAEAVTAGAGKWDFGRTPDGDIFSFLDAEKEYKRGFEDGRKSVFSEMRESGNLEPVPRIPAE